MCINFLLHQEWARVETGDAGLAAASMLPDLWRMAERRARLGSRHLRLPERDRSALIAGLAHHLDTDRWFHDDQFFTDGEARTVQALRAAGVVSEKMVLFAHPLWELLLDGALVRRVGLAVTLADVGAAHRLVGGLAGRELAASVGLEQLLPEHHAREGFFSKLESLWEALLEGRWLGAYTNAEGLAECIVQMRRRIGISPLVHGDRARLVRAIEALEPEAERQLRAQLEARAALGSRG